MATTIKELINSNIVNKTVKQFEIINRKGQSYEILNRRDTLNKYGNYEYVEYRDSFSEQASIVIDYNYDKLDTNNLHSLIESLQKLEKKYGKDCQLKWDNSNDIADVKISCNTSLSNNNTIYFKNFLIWKS